MGKLVLGQSSAGPGTAPELGDRVGGFALQCLLKIGNETTVTLAMKMALQPWAGYSLSTSQTEMTQERASLRTGPAMASINWTDFGRDGREATCFVQANFSFLGGFLKPQEGTWLAKGTC